MAYFSLGAYDANVFIPQFAGLKQDDEIASDLRFAREAENVETVRGVLQPMAACTVLGYEFPAKIETMVRFYRRWYTGEGSKDWIVVAAGGKIYAKQTSYDGAWSELPLPEYFKPNLILMIDDGTFVENTERVNITRDVFREKAAGRTGTFSFTYTPTQGWYGTDGDPAEYGVTFGFDINAYRQVHVMITYRFLPESIYRCNRYSCVNYEINPEGAASPVDVLLMSNADRGMIMIVPPFTDEGPHAEWMVYKVNTPYNFGVIERYAERIWGGGITDEPDTLAYSRPYDPEDWSGAYGDEEPEDVGGDVRQPSWDGDSFTALRQFGGQLLGFKKNRVWRIMGTDPGEYVFKEQYGGGTPFADTIAVETERILMAEKDGLSVYDGMSVAPFRRNFIENVWKRVNREAMDEMCAALYKDRYYLAVPLDGATANNALIVYNIEEGTFLLYTDIYIESMMATDEALYATSSTLPGKILIINYDSWETGECTDRPTRWETPWMDFGRKTIAKGGYEIYFNPEVKGYPVTFRFSIETEKKVKSKTVTVPASTFKAKQKRVRFGGTSRRFRLIIETLPGHPGSMWRLTGGIQMVVETDPD